MDSREVLDQIARLGLFGKRYKDFESAPAEAQRVIRLLAGSNPTLPAAEPDTAPPLDRGDRAQRLDARLRKIEASIARLERGIAKLAEGLEQFGQLDVIRSATRLHVDRAMKIRAGIMKSQRMGVRWGRPPREFPREEARRLRAQGMSLRKIAKHFGIAHTTVADALKEEACTKIGRERWLN